MDSNNPIIEAKGIVTRFGKNTVHNGVDLTLYENEILGLVGGSGSGKSVLLRTLLGLKRPDEGDVFIKGDNVTSLTEAEQLAIQTQWGVLYQSGALFSGLSVLDNVGLPLREHTNLDDATIDHLASLKLKLVGLKPQDSSKKPSELSGGMIKRAAIARAISMDPQILFLDEPTAGLDPIAAADFDELIMTLQRTMGLSILIITHDLDTLSTVCDRVAVLVDGKAVSGTFAELMESEHPWIKKYFHGTRMRAVQKHEKEVV